MKFFQNLRLNQTKMLTACIAINVSFIIFSVWEYIKSFTIYGDRGRLPQPFSIYRADIFMDYYNVNYHALSAEFFSGDFKSVYSSLFRIFARVFTSEICSISETSLKLRDCDINYYFIFPFFLLCIIYLFIKIPSICKNKHLWILLFITSFPFLYMLERGNYIIISLILISLLALAEKEILFNIILAILPLTKSYFLFNFLIYLKQGTKNIFIYVGVFLAIHMGLSIFYGDGFTEQLINLVGFSRKTYNIHEILVATTFRPLAAYSGNPILILLAKALILIVFVRLYLYLSIFLNQKLKVEDYKFLVLILTLFLIIVIDAIGFYGVVLLYPLLLYFISKKLITDYEKILIMLISIPYPINLYKFEYLYPEGVDIFIQVQSILIPLLLFILFISLTKNIRIKNEN